MKKQNGFTLIELVVVMVILGILAAVALPKFVNMSGQARIAKMNGAVGAVQSSITLTHAKWLAVGSPTGATPTIDFEGNISLVPNAATDMKTGYPAAAAFANSGNGAKNIAGLDTSYTVSVASGVATISDATKTGCSFTVTDSTGAGLPPVVNTANLSEANCQ